MPEGAVLPSERRDKTGAPFIFRDFEAADRPELDVFYHEFAPKRIAQGLPPEGEHRIRRWLDAVLAHGTHLLAVREGRIIGHCMLVPTREPTMAEYAVYVHQDYRGRGLGTEMNRAALDVAGAAGFRRIWLSVEPGNRAAVRSYEKAGFRFLPGTILSLEAEMAVDLAPGSL